MLAVRIIFKNEQRNIIDKPGFIQSNKLINEN